MPVLYCHVYDLSARAVSADAGSVLYHTGNAVCRDWGRLTGPSPGRSDSFAYFAGKKFGKTHMAPHISPKKTLEGLIGGAAGAIICCILFSVYAGYPVIYGGILGIVLSIVAPIGDLFESYMKRVCGIKDSGNLLPGHGGMLDRFDSMYFVAPVMVSLLVLIHQL